MMDFVSWDDDIPFPTVSGKSIQIHAPNHQPVIIIQLMNLKIAEIKPNLYMGMIPPKDSHNSTEADVRSVFVPTRYVLSNQ